VPTEHVRKVLAQRGFQRLGIWGRGVDIDHFSPAGGHDECIERPLFLYVGRLAVEKNVEAFLKLDLPGTKWLIGDGPQREELEKAYPKAHFLGAKAHAQLPAYYNCADAFVFPSLTDTFGLVLVEAMACGVPVAAFPVEGPIDVVSSGKSGWLDSNLERACLDALTLDRAQVRQHALAFSWLAATQQFLQNLRPVRAASAQKSGHAAWA